MKTLTISQARRYVLSGYTDEQITDICECEYKDIKDVIEPVRKTLKFTSDKVMAVRDAVCDLAMEIEEKSAIIEKLRDDENHDKRVEKLLEENRKIKEKFALGISEKEVDMACDWHKEHIKKYPDRYHNHALEYTIVPTAFGSLVKARCRVCFNEDVKDCEITLREIAD